jgi:hypothetical protein
MRHSLSVLLSVALVTSGHAQVPNYVPTDGLVGWWPFNGNANDESGTGNSGSPMGPTLVADRFGTIASAYSFNGTTDMVVVPEVSGSLNWDNLTDDYTLALWCRSANPNLGSASSRLIEFSSTAAAPAYAASFQVRSTDNDLLCLSYDAVNLDSVNVGNEIFDGEWHMVAMVMSNTVDSMFAYVDGVRVGETQSVLSGSSSTGDSLIFGNRSQGGRPYAGELDDIGAWGRALSDAEILGLFIGSGVSISDVKPEVEGLRAYPNPSRGQFTVEMDLQGHTTLQVFDVSGKLVHSESFPVGRNRATRIVDLSALQKGSYTMQVRNGGQVASQIVTLE